MLLGFYSTNECNGGQHLPRKPWRYWSSWGCCCCQHHTCASIDPMCRNTHVPCCADTLRRLELRASVMGHAHHFGLTLSPEHQALKQSGKLTSEISSTVFGALALFLRMCFRKEAQTLKYLSVRGEEPCGPKCFQKALGEGVWGASFSSSKKGSESISKHWRRQCFSRRRWNYPQRGCISPIKKPLLFTSVSIKLWLFGRCITKLF